MMVLYIDGILASCPVAKSSWGRTWMIRCTPAFCMTGFEPLRPSPPFSLFCFYIKYKKFYTVYRHTAGINPYL